MYPKFVIVSQPGEIEGFLRLGHACNHRDLVRDYEKVHGGGWYYRDDHNRKIVLYGYSVDYGLPDFTFMDILPRELEGYSIHHSDEIVFMPGYPSEPMDLSHVKYI